jgi:hypothetical protein
MSRENEARSRELTMRAAEPHLSTKMSDTLYAMLQNK